MQFCGKWMFKCCVWFLNQDSMSTEMNRPLPLIARGIGGDLSIEWMNLQSVPLFCRTCFSSVTQHNQHTQTWFYHRCQWIKITLQVPRDLASMRLLSLLTNEHFLWHLPLKKFMRKLLLCTEEGISDVAMLTLNVSLLFTSQTLHCGYHAASKVALIILIMCLQQWRHCKDHVQPSPPLSRHFVTVSPIRILDLLVSEISGDLAAEV